MAEAVRWYVDPGQEDDLTQRKLMHDTLTIQPSDIDWAASNKIQNRPDGKVVDQPHVDQFVQAMRNGAMIPAITVWCAEDTGALIITDGRHRAQAARRVGVTDWLVQRFYADYDVAMDVAADANLRNGKDVPVAYRMARAVQYARRGIRLDDIAVRLNVTRATISRYLQQTAQEDRMRQTFGNSAIPRTGISGDKAVALAKIEDEPLRILGPLIIDTAARDLTNIAEEIKAADPSQRAAVAHEVKGRLIANAEAAAAVGQRPTNKAVTSVRRACTEMRRNLTKALDTSTARDANKIIDDVLAIATVATNWRDNR